MTELPDCSWVCLPGVARPLPRGITSVAHSGADLPVTTVAVTEAAGRRWATASLSGLTHLQRGQGSLAWGELKYVELLRPGSPLTRTLRTQIALEIDWRRADVVYVSEALTRELVSFFPQYRRDEPGPDYGPAQQVYCYAAFGVSRR